MEAQRDSNPDEKNPNGPSVQVKADPLSGFSSGYQMSIFQLDDPVLKQVRDEIAGIDINNLTPIEALNKLNEIKKACGIR